MELILTNHAYERYVQRVGLIDRDELTRMLKLQIHQPDRRKREYIQLAGIWWRYGIKDGIVILHTCYGEHHMDLPAAIKWAKRFKDRIALGDAHGD
jgi:hypothetical protein